ncbi:hypothetical protein [Bifidobacterium simiiventris]|uniref:hypothetical protein n=1 Tax=Bifidobacterium simiiventris TaxID=2834434 RepID=UPI001C59AC77|nr:hypothetical protein [Bifidobacterium simiiventris]MBW3078423.1 hypothetical protein [Bifidobacterium simiiventris]
MNPNPYPPSSQPSRQPQASLPPQYQRQAQCRQPSAEPASGQPYDYPPTMSPYIPPVDPQRQKPNEVSRSFAVAGLVLAVMAAVFALMPLWDKVSVFGVVGLSLDAIAACSLFSDRNRTPVWIGMVVVAAVLCIASILVVALT